MNTNDPMNERILLLRVGWMDNYAGVTATDEIVGGGAYVAEHGFGHEIFNFKSFEGRVYGYAQPPGRKDHWLESKINLNRLGASSKDDEISCVLVVWVATHPEGGEYVVGWYKNATLYRNYHQPPEGSGRKHKETEIGYYVTALAEDATLLPKDKRTHKLPQQKPGSMGQSNVWYADDPELHKTFRENLLAYIGSDGQAVPAKDQQNDFRRQADPKIRQQVEEKAIAMTWAHFESLRYELKSVEDDNVGWDLTAKLDKRELKLEVKGLSSKDISIQLTPNEYRAMKAFRDQYRVCVVTSALDNPQLEIFAYSAESKNWEGQLNKPRVLEIQEIVAARCSAV